MQVLLSCAMRVDVVCSKPDHRRRALVCIEIPRSDTGGGCDYEVTVTSEDTHKQKERINRQEKAAPSGGLDKGRGTKDGDTDGA